VAPPSAPPGQTAVIGVTAKVSLRKIPAHDVGSLRTLRSAYLPCCWTPCGSGCWTSCGSGRPALPLRRWFVRWLLRLRRERKSSQDRYQRNGDPRAFEATHGLVSPLPPEPALWISCTSKSTLPAALDMNANVMPLSRHKHPAIACCRGGRFAPHRHFFVLQGAAFAL
jgi:hypothetical protein